VKIFNRPSPLVAAPTNALPPPSRGPSLQQSPVTQRLPAQNRPVTIKVDLAVKLGNSLLVAGWHSGPVDLALAVGTRALDTQQFATARPDVATALNLPATEPLGFALVVERAEAGDPSIVCVDSDGAAIATYPLKLKAEETLPAEARALLAPALSWLSRALTPGSADWTNLIAMIPTAHGGEGKAAGFLELALVSDVARQGVVVGWSALLPGDIAWIEDERGGFHSLHNAHRVERPDVHAAVGPELADGTPLPGFLLRLDNVRSGTKIRLKALRENSVRVLHEITCGTLPNDPAQAAGVLFGLATPMGQFVERLAKVDRPILDALAGSRHLRWASLPVRERQLGKPVAAPKAAIVVPLYGRTDFVEHQLLEFARDAWIREHAEIVYVIDDPRLVDPFAGEAETLFRLYKVPFKWVWGGVNRGFSGANNLGARHSKAPTLLFLNSDAFPRQPGWLEALVGVLDARADIGAVGPRLLFADGSIQHAGIEFMRREELGVWINHHPNMGLDPSLDPHHGLTLVPAVTGACLCIRRADLDRLGGWDTGYVVGDFEDTDLCLKLQSEGMKVAYLPEVELTHLERQSFKLLGGGDLRTRIVLSNAQRHQNRWGPMIEAAASANS
jgi:GT2 family glycosyltransferase